MPIELRSIPYDINSVMHFGPRDFSKNGHRTILFKDHNLQQSRLGLTKLDVRKIETIYGPECRARDREEKLQLCQSYPGVARKKRDTNLDDNLKAEEFRSETIRNKRDIETSIDMSSTTPDIDRNKRDAEEIEIKNLRVNPDITPPPNTVKGTLEELGIEDAVQEIVDQVHKVNALALKNARSKYCNDTKPSLRTTEVKDEENADVLGIIEVIANFAQNMVGNAVANLTKFCEESESIEVYQRTRCGWNDNSDRCRQTYRSTKSGAVKYSTQHRPVYFQSTNIKMVGHNKGMYARSGNDSDDTTTEAVSLRRKRDVGNEKDEEKVTDKAADEPHLDDKAETKEKSGNEEKNIDNNNGNANITFENKEDRAENKEDKAENKEDQAQNKEENGNKNEAKDDALTLRSGTAIPVRSGRSYYEPVRRQGRRHRARYTKNEEDIDRSSLSTEIERPKKKIHRKLEPKVTQKHREHIKEEYTKDDHSKPVEGKKRKNKETTEDNRKPKQKWRDDVDDRKRKREETSKEDNFKPMMKRNKKYGGRGHKEDDAEETEHITERQKKRSKKEPRSDDAIPQIVQLSKANKDFYSERKWPGGVLKYVIQEDSTYDMSDLRHRLEEVIDILKQKTCVRMKEITEDQATNHQDYIVIDAGPDYVTGRVGGRQSFGSIELFRGGQHRQHAAMMVMAMLGYYFEVSRHDRDKYVRVHMRHVRPDKLHHFEKIRHDATLPFPYDYKSATQPAWQYWRQLGRSGISTVATYKQQDPDGSLMKSMGQNSQLLSDIDIMKINSVYGDKCLQNARTKTKESEAKPSKGQKEDINVDDEDKK